MGDKYDKNLDKVRELIDLMKENDLLELEIADGSSKIHIKRPGAAGLVHIPVPAITAVSGAVPVASTNSAAASEAGAAAAVDNLVKIKSPIVGTFYATSSPDAEPYVTQGSKVEPETVVCIIEAMKVMNEIKAETMGTIVKVHCKDGQSVEYGQTLFSVRP